MPLRYIAITPLLRHTLRRYIATRNTLATAIAAGHCHYCH
jgi:hypothetical protein